MRPLLVDIGPLRRFPSFRKLWVGYVLRQLGAQLTATTVLYQIFAITHSNAEVGLVSLAQLGPAIVAPIVGGAVADAIDRRALLVATAVLFALTTTALALNASGARPALLPIYLCAAITQGLNGIDGPTRTAVTITLVDRESILSANVLRQMVGQISMVVGPGFAGILIAGLSHHIAYVYWIDVASTVAALQAVIRLPPLVPGGAGRRFGLGSIAEGFRYVRDHQVLRGCLISDFVPSAVAQPNSLFPYMAIVHFHGGARAFGLISAAPAVGALVGAILSGWTHGVRRQGRGAIVAAGAFGISVAGFGSAPWLWLGVACMAVQGWANATMVLFRTTILQSEVPDRLRGRISATDTMIAAAGPKIGSTDNGLIAGAASAQIALVSGGLACLVGAIVMAKAIPRFAAYDTSDPRAPELADEVPT